jgi:hypothetical protein
MIEKLEISTSNLSEDSQPPGCDLKPGPLNKKTRVLISLGHSFGDVRTTSVVRIQKNIPVQEVMGMMMIMVVSCSCHRVKSPVY